MEVVETVAETVAERVVVEKVVAERVEVEKAHSPRICTVSTCGCVLHCKMRIQRTEMRVVDVYYPKKGTQLQQPPVDNRLE